MKIIIFKILLPLIIVCLVFFALIFFGQRSLMYFPQSALPAEVARTILPEGQMIKVATADGLHLNAYFMPPKDESYPIILAFHGNGSLGLYMVSNFSEAIKKGYGVLLAEYRGYGDNEGSPSEEGLYKDADAYLNYLSADYPDTKLIAYGQSLGSAVVIDLVTRQPDSFAGMILEAPFDSALNVADKIYPNIMFKKWILRDQYLSIEKIGKITIPKLFLLAGKDEIVGLDGGFNLFDAATDPKLIRVYSEASHMGVFQHGAGNDLMDFIESLNPPADIQFGPAE